MCARGRQGGHKWDRVMTAKVGTSGSLMAADVARLALLWQTGFSHLHCHLPNTPEMQEGTYVEAHFVHPTATF